MEIYEPTENEVRIAKVVGEAWLSIQNDKAWAQVCKYLDIGLPIAFCYTQGLCLISDEGFSYVENAYEILLQSLEINPSEKFESWVEVIDHVHEEDAKD